MTRYPIEPLRLSPSRDRADWVAFRCSCAACGADLEPLGATTETGVVSWLPVKCTNPACRREWAVKAQLVAVTDQAQARYVGGPS